MRRLEELDGNTSLVDSEELLHGFGVDDVMKYSCSSSYGSVNHSRDAVKLSRALPRYGTYSYSGIAGKLLSW